MKKEQSEPGFEERMKRLEQIVDALESPDISLEAGMALYREGALCARFCREKLEKARHELEMWQDGEAVPLELDKEEESGD